MSFTLMRHKDGIPAPIKISVWDAFLGVPPPKPRLHQCSSCNSFHGPTNKAQIKSEKNKDSDTSKDAKAEKKADAEATPFTKEDDDKILKMKADGKTWADIAKDVGGGRSKSEVTRRFKEINAKDGAAKSDVKASSITKEKDAEETERKSPPDQTKMTKKEKKAAKAQHDHEEGLKRKEKQKGKGQVAGKTKGEGNENSTTKNVQDKGQADEQKDATAAADMKNPTVKDERQKWVATASKHFDRTGQRLTVEQARKMAEEKST